MKKMADWCERIRNDNQDDTGRQWASRAWQSVSEVVIKHSFKACGIALSLDGSEDARLNDRMAEAVNAANQRRANNFVRVG